MELSSLEGAGKCSMLGLPTPWELAPRGPGRNRSPAGGNLRESTTNGANVRPLGHMTCHQAP